MNKQFSGGIWGEYPVNKENKKEHDEQTKHDEAKGICDVCGETDILQQMLYQYGDKLMLCNKCYGKEEMRADMEYERQREEGIKLGE
jgi:hypothetical protein